jgi:hypothetical protein
LRIFICICTPFVNMFCNKFSLQGLKYVDSCTPFGFKRDGRDACSNHPEISMLVPSHKAYGCILHMFTTRWRSGNVVDWHSGSIRSILCSDSGYPEVFRVSPQFLQANGGIVLRIRNDRILPNCFQVINHAIMRCF